MLHALSPLKTIEIVREMRVVEKRNFLIGPHSLNSTRHRFPVAQHDPHLLTRVPQSARRKPTQSP